MDEQKKRKQQEKLIMKVLGNIRDHQFVHMNMEDMAKLMGISRATLYKYFANKEEIFEHFTDGLIAYFELDKEQETKEQMLGERFQHVFEQSTSLALLVPESFLKQLEQMYPEMYYRLNTAISNWHKKVVAFYKDGAEKGVFRSLNPHLLIAQQQVFETLFNPKFLMQHQLTVEQALWDFYALQKHQLFKESHLEAVNDEVMKSKIMYLTNKVTNLIF